MRKTHERSEQQQIWKKKKKKKKKASKRTGGNARIGNAVAGNVIDSSATGLWITHVVEWRREGVVCKDEIADFGVDFVRCDSGLRVASVGWDQCRLAQSNPNNQNQ